MKVAAIVAEYNPFHNGHKYHIEETKKQTGADYVIAIMSGDFVQRGAPAIMDKYDRAFCALSSGCDLVLELPVIYSTSSAEFFANGAVLTLNHLGVCDYLSFGSEAGSINDLSLIADILLEEPDKYQEILRNHLKSGCSFPAARALALEEYLTLDADCQFSNDFTGYLSGSNNILALEYLKSLKKYKSKLIPATILRKNAPYHDKKLHEDISSASAIREYLLTHSHTQELINTVPLETFAYITKNHQLGCLPDFKQLTPYLHASILNTAEPASILDWDPHLANRLENISWPSMDFSEIADALKSRNLTQTRIQRSLLHLILNIKTHDFWKHYENNPIPYARILGFRKESSPLLKAIKKNSTIPVITKPASIHKVLSPDNTWMWDIDLKGAKLYQSIVFHQAGIQLPSPYKRTPVIV